MFVRHPAFIEKIVSNLLQRSLRSRKTPSSPLPLKYRRSLSLFQRGWNFKMNYTHARAAAAAGLTFICMHSCRNANCRLNAQTDGWLLNTFSKQELTWAARSTRALKADGVFGPRAQIDSVARACSPANPPSNYSLCISRRSSEQDGNLILCKLSSSVYALRGTSNCFDWCGANMKSEEFGFWLLQSWAKWDFLRRRMEELAGGYHRKE